MGQDTFVTGFLEEATEGTSPITGSGVSYYEFGDDNRVSESFPYREEELGSYQRGSRDPRLYITYSNYIGLNSFYAVNGIPLYLALGDSNTDTGVHTVTGIDSGRLPSFTTRWETRGTNTIRQELVGNKVKTLSMNLFSINERSRHFPLAYSLDFRGIGLQTASYDSNHDPIFPGSEDNRFVPDSSFVFNWDDGGVNETSYANDIIDFAYTLDMRNIPQQIRSNKDPQGNLEGGRSHVIVMNILREADDQLLTDFLAQTRSSTGKSMRMKIFRDKSGSSDYIEPTWQNCLIKKVTPKKSKREELDYWEIVIHPQLYDSNPPVTVDVKDGLTAATFYGE